VKNKRFPLYYLGLNCSQLVFLSETQEVSLIFIFEYSKHLTLRPP